MPQGKVKLATYSLKSHWKPFKNWGDSKLKAPKLPPVFPKKGKMMYLPENRSIDKYLAAQCSLLTDNQGAIRLGLNLTGVAKNSFHN